MKELNAFDKVRVLVYRVHEKGLEVFLLKDKNNQDDSWQLPASDMFPATVKNSIELDPLTNNSGGTDYTIAVEGDYHDIPSIRGLVKSDIKLIKDKVYEVLPDLEKGTFVAAKEVFKKLLPNEYAAVKELKDIIIDRNTVINI